MCGGWETLAQAVRIVPEAQQRDARVYVRLWALVGHDHCRKGAYFRDGSLSPRASQRMCRPVRDLREGLMRTAVQNLASSHQNEVIEEFCDV